MIGIALFTLIIALLGAGAGYLLYQLLTNFQPGSNKINQDLERMRSEIDPWVGELVPWTQQDMELLSHHRVNQELKKGIAPTAKGVLTSIYNEPMMAYSYKRYVSPNRNALLLVRTSNHEWVYRIRDKKVEVMIDRQVVGDIREDGRFYHRKSNQLLAQIQRGEDELILPVLVGEREVGSLSVPEAPSKIYDRAFQLLAPMTEEEEALFLSLSAYELIQKELPLRKKK